MDFYKQFSESIILEKQFKKRNHIYFSLESNESEYKEIFLKLVFESASDIFLLGYKDDWNKVQNWTLMKEFKGTGFLAKDDMLNWYEKYGDLSNILKLDESGNYKFKKELVDLDLILGLHRSSTLRIISGCGEKTVGYCGCGEVWFQLNEFESIWKYLCSEISIISIFGERDNKNNLIKLKKLLNNKKKYFYLNCSVNYFDVVVYAISDLIGEIETIVFEPSMLQKTKLSYPQYGQ